MENQEKIIWRDEFSIGNTDIDDVHKNMFDIYNKLIEFFEKKGDRKEFALILSQLTEYCLMHFKKEEEYMQKLSYPELSVHKKQHKHCIYKIAMYNIDLLGPNPPEQKDVIGFINKWLVTHILISDKKYEAYKREIHADVKY